MNNSERTIPQRTECRGCLVPCTPDKLDDGYCVDCSTLQEWLEEDIDQSDGSQQAGAIERWEKERHGKL